MQDIHFERIVKEYGGRLYGYLLKFVNHTEDAEDLLQSVFTAFYNNMAAVDENRYPSYLYRTAHNKAINHMKKNKRYASYHESLDNHYVEPEQTNPKIDELNKALKTLKPKELQVVELKIYQKLSYQQIADILDTTVSAVDSLLVRAKRKLRKYLQDK